MAELPPAAIYAALAVATFIENFVPPIPSDVLTALAAFLSHRGTIDPWSVFLWSWLGNVAGAAALYALAHRYGRAFLAGRTGQRLVSAEALAGMEREYLRFGVVGIFLARLLPGLRSFVAVFVGVINLGPARALLPIGLAAGLWYAFLVFVGAKVGAQWEDISRIVSRMNRTLSIIAALVIVVGVILVLRRRRRPAREGRLWTLIRTALHQPEPAARPIGGDPGSAAAATLLLELSRHAHELSPEEKNAIEVYLRERWNVTPTDEPLFASVPDLERHRDEISTRYGRQYRLELAARLWRVAAADGALSLQEDRLMRRSAQLLGLTTEELDEARRQVLGRAR
ncbi:MAG: VTT domain-containing protein [Gemmatimonadota bacterium]